MAWSGLSSQSNTTAANDRGEQVGSDAWWATQDQWAADRGLSNGGRHIGHTDMGAPGSGGGNYGGLSNEG